MADTMTMDQDDTTTSLLAERIRKARADAGLSRQALSQATGIPARSIERFEAGEQEVSVQRLKAISAAVGKPVPWFYDGEAVDDTPSPIPSRAPERGSPNRPRSEELDLNGILTLLDELDSSRAAQFDGSRRRADALRRLVEDQLRYLEPAELLDVAIVRGINPKRLPRSRELDETLEKDFRLGQVLCSAIGARIIDTAIIGSDLMSIDRQTLVKTAADHGVEADGFFGWTSCSALTTRIRPVIIETALAGRSAFAKP